MTKTAAAASLALAACAASAHVPRRSSRVYVQKLVAPPEQVLPLLTPLGEKAWAGGWEPVMLRDEPGFAGSVFATSHHGPPETIWVMERYDPEGRAVRYTRVKPGSDVCEIDIVLAPTASGCDATVRYTWTSLGPAGDAVIDKFDEAHYLHFMTEWEQELNHYLKTGQKR